jgi:8-oxo-dGTP pyrophosphatase MutT (NUDIX family)
MTDYLARARAALAGYAPRRLDGTGYTPAAVLLLLAGTPEGARVVLTVRSHDVEHHKGQISFPGGATHPADADLTMTALRETWEEIGVSPEDVEVIGQLDDMITISNFVVTPFAGVLRKPLPFEYVASAAEVGEVIEPPLRELLSPGTLVWEDLGSPASARRAPAYHWNGYRIWGATGRMLHGFLQLIDAQPAK